MVKTFYYCDLCNKENDEQEEFKNQVLLVGKAGTERGWKICEPCLTHIREVLQANQKDDVRN